MRALAHAIVVVRIMSVHLVVFFLFLRLGATWDGERSHVINSSLSHSTETNIAANAVKHRYLQESYNCLNPKDSATNRIALGFFGMSRSLRLTLPSIIKRVFDVLDRHEIAYDIFWCTSITSNVVNAGNNGASLIDPFEVQLLPHKPCHFSLIDQGPVQAEYMEKFFSVRNITVITKRTKKRDFFNDSFSSMKNLMTSYHTQIQLDKMIADHQLRTGIAYDAYVALRPDTAMVKDLDIAEHLSAIKQGGRLVFIPDFQHWFGGLNDRAAFGTPDGMSLYLRRGQQFRDSNFHGSGEMFLPVYGRQHNITFMMSKLKFIRVRQDGSMPRTETFIQDITKFFKLPLGDPDMHSCVDYKRKMFNPSCGA